MYPKQQKRGNGLTHVAQIKTYEELHLHSPYAFMVWCSIMYRKNDACVQLPFVAQGYIQRVFN